jgi:hypothetical protein
VSGLKLCPITVSFRLTLEFQRGLTAGCSVLGLSDRVGVATAWRDGVLAYRFQGRVDMWGPDEVPKGTLE